MIGFLKHACGWLVVNAFLLAIILVGAVVFWLLGAGVKALSLDNELERWLFAVVAIISIFASYYFGKFLHDLAEGRYRRRSDRS